MSLSARADVDGRPVDEDVSLDVSARAAPGLFEMGPGAATLGLPLPPLPKSPLLDDNASRGEFSRRGCRWL